MSTYICTDLHGNYKIWAQMRDSLQPDDTLYCLGDCNDRGRDGILILREMMRDSRVINFLGNHEEFILEYAKATQLEECPSLWEANGGESTFQALKSLSIDERSELVAGIRSFKIFDTIEINSRTFILSHSGFNPSDNSEEFAFRWNSSDRYIWNRDHIFETLGDKYKDVYMIFGHTPVPSLKSLTKYMIAGGDLNNPTPANILDTKYDLDLGTFATGKAALMCLDDLSMKYFYDEELYKTWIA